METDCGLQIMRRSDSYGISVKRENNRRRLAQVTKGYGTESNELSISRERAFVYE